MNGIVSLRPPAMRAANMLEGGGAVQHTCAPSGFKSRRLRLRSGVKSFSRCVPEHPKRKDASSYSPCNLRRIAAIQYGSKQLHAEHTTPSKLSGQWKRIIGQRKHEVPHSSQHNRQNLSLLVDAAETLIWCRHAGDVPAWDERDDGGDGAPWGNADGPPWDAPDGHDGHGRRHGDGHGYGGPSSVGWRRGRPGLSLEASLRPGQT